MSLIALAALAAVASAAGYWAARRRIHPGPEAPLVPAAPPTQVSRFGGMPLAVGDVVSTEGTERWLAGAAVALDRGAVVAALFFAPEGASEAAVMAQPEPERSLFWLEPARALDLPDEPPATLEIDRATFARRRRLPVRIERVGHSVPAFGDTGLWAIYEGAGREVALVVTSNGQALAWTGRRLLEREYERLGSGGD